MPKICYNAAAQATLFIQTRDEHCDPHVHAFNTSDNWEVKVFFSYAGNDPVHNTFKILTGRPTMSQIKAVIRAMNAHLLRCREEWWLMLSCVCLKNQMVLLDSRGVLQRTSKSGKHTLWIESAKYIVASNAVQFKALGSNVIHTGTCP